jgi:O-antigen ligase
MLRISVAIAILVCAYPGLRIVDKFPTQMILDYAAMIQEDRMFSLKFRFDNETVLIEHALKKPWFGWGYSYGRNLLYDETGYSISTTDGGWIIAFGGAGVLGLIIDLGLPVFAIFTIWGRIKKIRDTRARTTVGVLTLYLAFMLLDVIPNAAFNWLQFYMAGALCGITQTLASRKKPAPPKKRKAEEPPEERATLDPEPSRPEPINV